MDMKIRIDSFNRQVWIYGLIAAAVALAGGAWFQLSVLTLLLIMLLLACPMVVIWAYCMSCRPLPVPLGPVPYTRGRIRYFNWIAPWYDVQCKVMGLDKRFRDQTMSYAGLREGETVLDAGCGNGVLTRLIAQRVGAKGQAWGIDAAPDMIRVAMQTHASGANAPAFKLAAMEALPFADATFDAVIASLVLHQMPASSKAQGLKEISRVLKPGGHLLVVSPDRPANLLLRALCGPFLLLPRLHEHLDGQMPDLLRAASFGDVVAVGHWGRWLTFWSARKKQLGTTDAVDLRQMPESLSGVKMHD